MPVKLKTFYSKNDLKDHLKTHKASFYFSSKTSTVVPYDKLDSYLNWTSPDDFYLCDLSKMPHQLTLNNKGNLVIEGAVSWEDAKNFLKQNGKNLKTSPTEQLALISAGVATSCTGERCFSFGNMRSQVVRLKYLDYNGNEIELHRDQAFHSTSSFLKPYQNDFSSYKNFKNAPYPRFEKETDLMIGTEGQLGVVTEVEIEVTDNFQVQHLFILLPRWEENCKAHLELYQKVQAHRQSIISCELLDANCMNYLKDDEKLGKNQDVIFLEIRESDFENIFTNVLGELKHTPHDQIYEISQNKFHHIRASVPRAIFEENSKMGVVKIGTDAQVSHEHFKDLIEFYGKITHVNVRYCLFGHFGDAHLHFNFMPTKSESEKCQAEILKLYDEVYKWHGSPFAEHGIGFLKQKFIKKFHGNNQLGLFKDLKKEHDPYNQFFPQGFMSASP